MYPGPLSGLHCFDNFTNAILIVKIDEVTITLKIKHDIFCIHFYDFRDKTNIFRTHL